MNTTTAHAETPTPQLTPPVPRWGATLRVLRAEFLHGIGPWAGAAVALAILAAMATHVDHWQARWAEASALLRTATVVIGGPTAAAAGCWQGAREWRRDTRGLLASLPRPSLDQASVAAAPAALWPVVGQLIASVAVFFATVPYAGYGNLLLLSQVVADSVILAALGTFGFVVGRLVRWRETAPLLAACVYVVGALPSYTASPLRRLVPGTLYVRAEQVPTWWFGPVSVLWAGGLGAAVLLAYAARHRAVAVVPLVVALAAATVLVRGGEGAWQDDPGARRTVCVGTAPQVCVAALDAKRLPALAAALAGPNSALRGVPGAPRRWVAPPGQIHPGDARLPDLTWLAVRDRLRDPAAYANEAVTEFLIGDCLTSGRYDTRGPGGPAADRVNTAVPLWLAPTHVPRRLRRPDVDARLAQLRKLPRAKARTFLARYLTVDRCDVAQVPMP